MLYGSLVQLSALSASCFQHDSFGHHSLVVPVPPQCHELCRERPPADRASLGFSSVSVDRVVPSVREPCLIIYWLCYACCLRMGCSYKQALRY